MEKSGSTTSPWEDREQTPNLIRNSGFETTTNFPVPDYWGVWDGNIKVPHLAEHIFTLWGVDRSQAWEGRQSMRICRPGDVGSPETKEYDYYNDFYIQSFWYSNIIEVGNPYVFSVYMKADRPGLATQIGINEAGSGYYPAGTTVEVGPTWKRYEVSTGKPLDRDIRFLLEVRPLKKGTIWIDAAQFEKGLTATKYVPNQDDLDEKMERSAQTLQTRVVTLSNPAVVDGRLDDASYKGVSPLTLKTQEGKEPVEKTEAYIFQEGQNLVVGMKCFQKNMAGLKAKAVRHDQEVYNDDCIEIFLDPSFQKKDFYHFAVNFNGVRYDDAKLDSSWNPEWEAKAFKGPDFWSVEMRLPISIFGSKISSNGTWGCEFLPE